MPRKKKNFEEPEIQDDELMDEDMEDVEDVEHDLESEPVVEDSSEPQPELPEEEPKTWLDQEGVTEILPYRGNQKDALKTKEALMNQPLRNFHIPLHEGEEDTIQYDEAFINGFGVQVQKGIFVDLPQSIVELFANKMKIASTAGRDKLINRNKEVLDALT
ncbi:MAG: hypothetical protein BWY14_01005 [Parcubacteria group bacterium ADurb.Bin192]|nr:MAG: hypothetical protein BWY14_01005 [Parcubacteria group bacterium ADurb.Bin192]